MGRPKTRFGPQKRITFEIPESEHSDLALLAAQQEPALQPVALVRELTLKAAREGAKLREKLQPRPAPRPASSRQKLAS